jgi:hypothetical protein
MKPSRVGNGVGLNTETVRLRSGLFVALLLVINVVEDGLPSVGTPFRMQIAVLPFTVLFLYLAYRYLSVSEPPTPPRFLDTVAARLGEGPVQLWLAYLFEILFVILFFTETTHYAALGYHLIVLPVLATFAFAVGALAITTWKGVSASPGRVLAVSVGTYTAGHLLAIASFPLNYLRSDMLPVIFWADRALLAGQNPYHPFLVANRVYDFPYLPGMLIVFAPAQALHLDLRWAAIAYIVGGMGLIYWASAKQFRLHTAALTALFFLSPYLQYRHELYTQGHFFSLILIFVLMQRRHFASSAAVFGISMMISQFSWVIFPFFLMNALRRGGWKEVARLGLIAVACAAAVMAPFYTWGAARIAHNAVGQWDNLAHAIARPMNLSFWLTYVVRPSHLKWVQLVLLTAIFGYCWVRGRCADLADTLRWMIAALIVFILLNVLLDGYFYLMLLVPMLVFTCVANGWWETPAPRES